MTGESQWEVTVPGGGAGVFTIFVDVCCKQYDANECALCSTENVEVVVEQECPS